MTEEVLYVTLFLAIYFQVFALLTYVSRDAHLRRTKARLESGFPHVAVVVPCWNEESTIGGTVASLLALDYPLDKMEIILVNDGSTDNTRVVMDAYADHPSITVIHKENGGKHAAVNLAIASTEAEFIGCLDADSFVHPLSLREILPHFDDPQVAAVTASMTVHEPKNILQRMQYAEYLAGVAMRHIFATVNGLYVTPGPFSFYRRSTLNELGGFRFGHQTEDMEMAMRLQKHGFKIENAPRAQVFTKAPHTLWGLVKQRTRWTSGFMRNSYDYRALFGNPKYGVLGLMVLPLGIIAILAGMVLFVLTLVDMATTVQKFIVAQGDVPLSFTFSLPAFTFDWFYMPITGVVILGAVGLIAAVTTMFVGKHISGAQRRIGPDIVWYVMLYSLIAPLWLFRSTRDVALGYRRSWR
jgi:biofilm PGA synthesis N-glycosyltransferase PgaC